MKFVATGFLAAVIIIGYSGYRITQLESEVQQKQERIHKMQGHLDSQQHRIRQLKDRLDRMQQRLHKSIRWTTRAIVSETTRPREMRVIAEIIRNRVESGWRGHQTYKGVILDPYQFSAFNPGRGTPSVYRAMTRENTPFPSIWREARGIAEKVLKAKREDLLTTRRVLHFHHRQVTPKWAYRLERVEVGGRRLLAYRHPRTTRH